MLLLMDKKVLARKIVICIAALGSAFLFFCFMGKAYGNEAICPSWYDLIFGGKEVGNAVKGLAQVRKYQPSPAGIALFSLTIAAGSMGLWVFAASLTHEKSNVSMSLGLTSIHSILVFLGLVLCCFVLPIYVGEKGSYPLGLGSVWYIILTSFFLTLDLVGIAFLLKEKKVA